MIDGTSDGTPVHVLIAVVRSSRGWSPRIDRCMLADVDGFSQRRLTIRWARVLGTKMIGGDVASISIPRRS